jgi:hypothetical protein
LRPCGEEALRRSLVVAQQRFQEAVRPLAALTDPRKRLRYLRQAINSLRVRFASAKLG